MSAGEKVQQKEWLVCLLPGAGAASQGARGESDSTDCVLDLPRLLLHTGISCAKQTAPGVSGNLLRLSFFQGHHKTHGLIHKICR